MWYPTMKCDGDEYRPRGGFITTNIGTDCLLDSHHCVGQGTSEASSLTYLLSSGFFNPEPLNLMKETIMTEMISKSKFKPRALHYFRVIEKTGRELIICDRGKPVLKIVPYADDPEKALKALRNTVIKYEDPTEPVGMEDWEALR